MKVLFLLTFTTSTWMCTGLAFPIPKKIGGSGTRLQAVSTLLPPQVSTLNGVADPKPAKKKQRRPIVAGNWKLNPSTKDEALNLLSSLAEGSESSAEVIVFPPLPYLSTALDVLSSTCIQTGAQNAGFRTKGAFTGETAPSMLASSGCSYVLLGHSERRTHFGETDASVNACLLASLAEPLLKVVLCVGETLEEYEAGLLSSVVDTQIRKALAGVPREDLVDGRVVIAYEPVWAIGTGLVATPEQAQGAHKIIRGILGKVYDEEVAEVVRIQYGGSVSPESVEKLMLQDDVDGCLVGGASLTADSFLDIIQGASSSYAHSSNTNPPALMSFTHAPRSYFSIPNLTPKGPRKNADVGEPHDSSRPLDSLSSLSTGSWWCAEGGWPSTTPRATTEIFYVFEGHGCVTDASGKRNFMGPGDLVVLPKGWAGRWDVLTDLHKVWVVADHPDVGADCGAIVEPYLKFAEEHLSSRSLLATATMGSPTVASRTVFDNGYVEVGCWSCTPGSLPLKAPRDKTLHVLEGIFFLTNQDGSARRCVAGDTVVLPKGWMGHADVLQTLKYLWVEVK